MFPCPVRPPKQEAVESLTVQVVGQSILVQGREVARLDGIEATDTRIAGLSEDWRTEGTVGLRYRKTVLKLRLWQRKIPITGC